MVQESGRLARADTAVDGKTNSEAAGWPIDTYVREVERCGGPEAMDVAEQIFRIDSDCVLRIVVSTLGDEGLEWRWRLGLCGVDLLLDALSSARNAS